MISSLLLRLLIKDPSPEVLSGTGPINWMQLMRSPDTVHAKKATVSTTSEIKTVTPTSSPSPLPDVKKTEPEKAEKNL